MINWIHYAVATVTSVLFFISALLVRYRHEHPYICTAFNIQTLSHEKLLRYSTQGNQKINNRNTIHRRSGAHRDDNIDFTSSSPTKKLLGAEFEYQEMNIILSALRRAQIVSSKQMDPVKAMELNSYIQSVVSNRKLESAAMATAISTDQQANSLRKNYLYNTTWDMIYSTMDILPRDTTVQLQFDGSTNNGDALSSPSMQYRLLFGSKTFGLQSINVLCKDWDLLSSSYNVNNGPAPPILLLTYDKLSIDAFGQQNIHICALSNLLKGRTNTIQSVYFDDTIWIEQQEQQPNESSFTIWNVYRKRNKQFDE